jgi:hypothetical protein
VHPGAHTIRPQLGTLEVQVMGVVGRGLDSFPIQLNLSSSVHRITRLNFRTCPGVAQVEL